MYHLYSKVSTAYAEAGQFAKAVETAEKAVRLALAAGQQVLAEDIRNRLKLYQAKRPYRQPPSRGPKVFSISRIASKAFT